MPKQQFRSKSNFYILLFPPSSEWRRERGWPKQLHVYSKNMKFYEKWLQRRSYFSKVKQIKNISTFYDKNLLITSLGQYWWLYCQIWKCFCLLILILKTTTPNNFTFHCNFTFSQTSDLVELYYALWSFTSDLILVSSQPYVSQFKIDIISIIAKAFITIVNRKSYFYSSRD